jgi:hypothetical protein
LFQRLDGSASVGRNCILPTLVKRPARRIHASGKEICRLIARARRFGTSLPDNGARRAGEPGMRILIARLIGGIVIGSVVRVRRLPCGWGAGKA